MSSRSQQPAASLETEGEKQWGDRRTLKNSFTLAFSLAVRLVITSHGVSVVLLRVSLQLSVCATRHKPHGAHQASPVSIPDSNRLPGASHHSAKTTMAMISHDSRVWKQTLLYNVLSHHIKFPSDTKADQLIHLTGLAENRTPLSWLTSA